MTGELKPTEKIELKASGESKSSKRDYFLLFLAGIVIVFIVGGVLLMLHNKSDYTPVPPTGLAVYNPQNLLDNEWNLDVEKTNLAEMPADMRSEMISLGVTDAATWEFSNSKSDEKLFFWARVYDNAEIRENNSYQFNGALNWRDGLRSNIAIGEEGIIGVYRMEGNDPLMVYAASGNQIWYVSYYNYMNEAGNAYNATELTADKQFLLDLMREFYSSFQSFS